MTSHPTPSSTAMGPEDFRGDKFARRAFNGGESQTPDASAITSERENWQRLDGRERIFLQRACGHHAHHTALDEPFRERRVFHLISDRDAQSRL